MSSTMFFQLLLVAALSSVVASKDVVEMLFVVEPQLIRNYVAFGYDRSTAETTFRGDLDFIVYEINKLFGTMKSRGVDVEIRVKKLIIMKEEMFKANEVIDETGIDADLSLKRLRNWLKNSGIEGYDLAMTLTGYDLMDEKENDRGVAGYASVSAVCGDQAHSISEFSGTQGSAAVMAHEIGHSLSSEHDGKKNQCSPDKGNIMAPKSSVDNEKRWSFSPCSAKFIKDKVEALNANGNCLRKTTTKAPKFKISSQDKRDIMNHQKLCQRAIKDVGSYLCLSPGLYNTKDVKGDIVCKKLYCGHTESRFCTEVVPTEGMMCDAGKRCSKGKCVKAPSSFPVKQKVNSDCVFGDQKGGNVIKNHGQCGPTMKALGGYQCSQAGVRSLCCETCRQYSTGIKGCEWGDPASGCSKREPSASFCTANPDVCCYTCRNIKAKRATLMDSLMHPKLMADEQFEAAKYTKAESKNTSRMN